MNKWKFSLLKTIFLEILLIFGACIYQPKQMEHSRKTSKEEWQVIKAKARFTVSPDFEKPKNLGYPINTLGWEDSPNISADGKTLIFAYVFWDMLASLSEKKVIISGPCRGFNDYGAHAFISTINVPWNWSEPKPLAFDVEGLGEVGPQLSFNGEKIYFSGPEESNSESNDLWYSSLNNDTWQARVNLGSPPNSHYYEEDPAVSRNQDTLFFWSNNKPGGLGDADIWMSKKNNDTWQEAVNLGSPINTPFVEMQPFFTWDGKWLYFTSNRDGKISIYRSRKKPDGTWQMPEVVIQPVLESGVYGVGEPTLTADGKYLYFVAAYVSSEEYDADILYTIRK